MLSSITLRCLAVAAVSVVLMTWTAAGLQYGANATVAAATGVVLTVIAWHTGREHLRDQGARSAVLAARHNAMIQAVTWLWGSVSLSAMYYLTDLSWYHAYEYAFFLLVPALICVFYARAIRREPDAVRRARVLRLGTMLMVLQVVLMAIVLAVLVAQGKIGGTRPDWAANHIFLWGPLTIAALSVVAIRSQRQLEAQTMAA